MPCGTSAVICCGSSLLKSVTAQGLFIHFGACLGRPGLGIEQGNEKAVMNSVPNMRNHLDIETAQETGFLA